MVKHWKGVVSTVDWTKKRVLLRCHEPGQGDSGGKEFFQVVSWDVTTRVTAADRGIIPIQQLQAGQMIYADCVQDQDGCWLARAVEVPGISASGAVGTQAQNLKTRERG